MPQRDTRSVHLTHTTQIKVSLLTGRTQHRVACPAPHPRRCPSCTFAGQGNTKENPYQHRWITGPPHIPHALLPQKQGHQLKQGHDALERQEYQLGREGRQVATMQHRYNSKNNPCNAKNCRYRAASSSSSSSSFSSCSSRQVLHLAMQPDDKYMRGTVFISQHGFEQSHNVDQNAGFETCFGWAPQHQMCWAHNSSRRRANVCVRFNICARLYCSDQKGAALSHVVHVAHVVPLSSSHGPRPDKRNINKILKNIDKMGLNFLGLPNLDRRCRLDWRRLWIGDAFWM